MKAYHKIKGFTLMEVIAVLAITATMAAVITPSIFDTINRNFGEAEANNLQTLSSALEQFILDNKQIPNQNINNWVTAIAAYTEIPRSEIEFNKRNFRRRLYADPRFFNNTDTVFPGYTQTVGLGAQPISPRLMLVSDLTANVSAPPTTSADFNAIWDQTAGAPVVEGELVKIERMQLNDFFNRVLLVNSNTQQSAYSLEGGGQNPVPQAVGGVDGTLTLFILKNTQLNLFFNPFPLGNLHTVTMINTNQSYHFETNGATWFWEHQ